MRNIIFFFSILSCIYILSCSDVKKNTSNDSELTLLMREMFDEGMEVKAQILNGEKPDIVKRAKQLMTAHSTDPEVAMSDKFKAFAQSYLTAVEVLENADVENRKTSYEVMVTTCMNCHQQLCPGPMVRIKKLYLN